MPDLKMKILIVDDFSTMRRIIKKSSGKWGMTISSRRMTERPPWRS